MTWDTLAPILAIAGLGLLWLLIFPKLKGGA